MISGHRAVSFTMRSSLFEPSSVLGQKPGGSRFLEIVRLVFKIYALRGGGPMKGSSNIGPRSHQRL